MNIHKKIIITASLLFFSLMVNSMHFFNSSLHAVSTDKKIKCLLEEMDTIADDALKLFNVPGCAVGVVIDDHIIVSRGYGLRQFDNESPVEENTLFSIGSCTKSFTAFLIGQLVEEGKVTLDDPVKKYLPEFCLYNQDLTDHVTIRDLLAHRTGIERHDALWLFSTTLKTSFLNVFRHFEPAFKLRQEFLYNNLMYSVLGKVIEQVTGQSWDENISSRLLKPLKMDESFTSLEQLQESSNLAMPHAEIHEILKVIPFCNTNLVKPGGGIHSTIQDMTKYVGLQLSDGTFLNKKFIQPEIFQELHTLQMPFSAKANEHEKFQHLGYALGWFVSKYREHHLISHGGVVDGYVSEVAFVPQHKIGIVVLTNSSTDGQYAVSCIRNQILDRLLGMEQLNWPEKIQEGRNKGKAALQKALQGYESYVHDSNLSILQDYVGFYEHPSYGTVKVKIENNHLVFVYGRLSILLYYKSEDVFTGQCQTLLNYGVNPVMDMTFFRDSSEKVFRMDVPFEGFRQSKSIEFLR